MASEFVEDWIRRCALERPGGRALDVAVGTGRHTVPIARAGFVTFGVDRSWDMVNTARAAVENAQLRFHGWCEDLTVCRLPEHHFDLVVVTRYLQRDLFPALRAALRPGGVLIYETFTIKQRVHGWGPASADHLLDSGELLTLAGPLDVVTYEEVEEPAAVARLAARRSSSRS